MATKTFLFMVFVFACMTTSLEADSGIGGGSDDEECDSEIMQLVPCLNFVQGIDLNPTTACCNRLVQVYSSSPKCLCLLMVNNRSGNGGISINQTLAMQMPETCHLGADVSKCPDLLHVSPNSPEGRIFKHNTNTSASTPDVEEGSSPPPRSSIPDGFVNLGSHKEADQMACVLLSMAVILKIAIMDWI